MNGMKEAMKKNFVIILAFLIPIGFIAAVALSTYLPSLLVSTKYNFIYASCTDTNNHYPYRCDDYLRQRYSVVDNALVVLPVDMSKDINNDGVPDANTNYSARIFFHDTEKNESREITLAEAQDLHLNNLITSPDGVTVTTHYSRSGAEFFPFGGGLSTFGYYLTKGKGRSSINLIHADDRYYYQNNFQFIGWVVPGRNS